MQRLHMPPGDRKIVAMKSCFLVSSGRLKNESETGMEDPIDIAKILNALGRIWRPQPPADEAAIVSLRKSASVLLPDEYYDLLRTSNGGEGPIDLPPLYFQLYDAEVAGEINRAPLQQESYPGFFVFGSNGGLETLAFDFRNYFPWPIVMFDPIAGPESAVIIATNMSDFIRAIGIDRNRFRFRIAEDD